MRRLIRAVGLLSMLLLAGCAGGPRNEISYFELGLTARQGVGLPLRALEVVSPSWLESGAMPYRLNYENPALRLAYSRARWVAPPAELLEHYLKRELLGGAGACRLRLELDEFLQVFDSPENSRGVLEVRASLYGPAQRAALAQRKFSFKQVAVKADAEGGAAALRVASTELSASLRDWISGEPGLLGACR